MRREYEQALDTALAHLERLGGPITLPSLYLAGRLEETRAVADSDLRDYERAAANESLVESLTAGQLAVGYSGRGLTHAFAGDMDAAVRDAEQALELYPAATDQVNYWRLVHPVCRIYILAGDYDAAIDQLEVLLSTPTPFTAARLRLDPFYDPLRDHPRFQALLEKYGT
jgi:tetratricopeptide (TPR) repeat protein